MLYYFHSVIDISNKDRILIWLSYDSLETIEEENEVCEVFKYIGLFSNSFIYYLIVKYNV